MAKTIQIGTTLGTLTYLVQLTPRIVEPLVDPIDYAETIEQGDGRRVGMGWLMQQWHWDILSEAQANALRAYIGTVYIRTLQNDGSAGVYTAKLVWPEKEPDHRAGRVLDLTLELRELVAVEMTE